LKPIELTRDDKDYKCKFLLFNSGDTYKLGEVFLKHFYSVYDIDSYKIGLGKLASKYDYYEEKEQVEESDPAEAQTDDGDQQTDDPAKEDPAKTDDDDVNQVSPDPEDQKEEKKPGEGANGKWVLVFLLVLGIIAAIILFVYFILKIRQKAASNDRKLPMVDPESGSSHETGQSEEEESEEDEDAREDLLG